ncbi:MAG: type III-A CRISPR-associated RAMP protein Csm5 [Bdellovibrionales bacterium]|nr:type III-A CRISPR-associated RAMP protein Csm5 [Bdellovibrionales bacterium]
MNEDALLADKLSGEADSSAIDAILKGRPPSELLEPDDFKRRELFRYIVAGTPFAKEAGSKVQEQIKDAYDRVYLPGSSLKGALRTMLFWASLALNDKIPDIARLRDGDPRRAAEILEREVFVPNPGERGRNAPNYDWLRSLHVADSNSLSATKALQLRTVMIYPTQTRDKPGLRIDVEAIADGTFQTELTVDEYGFTDHDAASKLQWTRSDRRGIDQLATIGRRYTEYRLRNDLAYFQRGPAEVLQIIQAFLQYQQQLPENGFLLQVGWGAGWESKTLGYQLLHQSDAEFEGILKDFRMNKQGANRKPGDPFPKTRALVMRGSAYDGPPGWLEVRLG